MKNEWQPIETAPMDGTVFLGLLYDGHNNYAEYSIVSWYKAGQKFIAEGGGTFVCDDYDEHLEIISYWMPLPTPPKEQQNDK